MQAFLLGELKRIVEFPSNQELMGEAEELLEASGTNVPINAILHARDKDRK